MAAAQWRPVGAVPGAGCRPLSRRPVAEVSVRRAREVFPVPGAGDLLSHGGGDRRVVRVLVGSRRFDAAGTRLRLHAAGRDWFRRRHPRRPSPVQNSIGLSRRAFAQGFWFAAQRDEEVACLKTDLGLDFVPEQYKELSWSAQYLCNRALEKSRYHLKRPDLTHVSRTWPLRCVLYRDSRFPFEEAKFARWLAATQERYELVGRESVSLPRLRQDERTVMAIETIDSYKFVPRDPSSPPVPLPPLADESASAHPLVIGKKPEGGLRQ